LAETNTNGKRTIAAYVLAGGQSSRFGRDKARAEVGGTPMLVRMCELAAEVAGSAAVVAPTGRYEDLGARIVADRWPGAGPLGGMATALLHTGETAPNCAWNLIVGCDLPFLTREWLVDLAQCAVSSCAQVVIPQTARGIEPLCACYRTEAGPVLAAALDRGVRKVTDGLEGLTQERLDEAHWKRFDTSGRLFQNMNTPEDYEAVRAAWDKMHR
jgi:molybdopterin-guanine dinucleotide biosynthesis protein A